MTDSLLPGTVAADSFALDDRLAADTIFVASWPLSEVRMMNDEQYPWLILVPRVPGAREVYELTDQQRRQLDKESVLLSRTIMDGFSGHKLNVAALGNVVSQLHIHHIVRFEQDLAWPAPVWGKFPVIPMGTDEISKRLTLLDALATPDWDA